MREQYISSGLHNSFCRPLRVFVKFNVCDLNDWSARATNSVQWRPLEVKTSSSAVAKRPRDASCLSVVSFVASIVQYLERSCVMISYFGFKFTSTYNSILFCCLRRNVEPCCHTHDSRYSIVVFNVPIDTLYVISETIYGSHDPTNSVIALKHDG